MGRTPAVADEPSPRDEGATRAGRDYVEATIRNRAFSLVYQPIVHLDSGVVSGVEALCRFHDGRRPDLWFDQCERFGLAVDMDFAVIEMAIGQVDDLPPGYVSLNLTAPTLGEAERLRDLLAPVRSRRQVVLELTERVVVEDYERAEEALDLLREADILFAVDDAGAGYSTFQHILRLRPDIIKLDRSITQSIDQDGARHALTSALVVFAAEVNASVIAEGIETESELLALRTAGVARGQGFWLARPASLPLPPVDYEPIPYVDLIDDGPRAGALPPERRHVTLRGPDPTVAVLAHNALNSMASILGAVELLRASDGALPLEEHRAVCSMMERRASYVAAVLKDLVRGLPHDPGGSIQLG